MYILWVTTTRPANFSQIEPNLHERVELWYSKYQVHCKNVFAPKSRVSCGVTSYLSTRKNKKTFFFFFVVKSTSVVLIFDMCVNLLQFDVTIIYNVLVLDAI